MRFVALILTCVFGLWPFVASAQAAAPPCQFELGFKTLHDMIATTVGNCLEDENHNTANGDGLQHTSGGLLVWRKLDNWTAFTDGFHTWINGPNGLQERLNSNRFPWEVLKLAGRAASDLPGTPIDLGTTLTSVVDQSTKPIDVYSVHLGAGDKLGLDYQVPKSEDSVLEVYGPTTTTLLAAGDRSGYSGHINGFAPNGLGTCPMYGTATSCHLDLSVAVGGPYYIVVDANGGAEDAYSLHVYLE